MNIKKCYLKTVQKVEENLTNGGIKIDPSRFVLLFNSEQNRYVKDILRRKNNDEIRKIQQLVVPSKKLDFSGKSRNERYYSLPNDFFEHSDLFVEFEKGGCRADDFEIIEVKNENVSKYLVDEFSKPSFEYRQTIYSIGGEKVCVYVDDFLINSVYIKYYRYPIQVDMEGYINENGVNSKNVDPEFDDKVIDDIINMIVKQYQLNENELHRYGIDSDNVKSSK